MPEKKERQPRIWNLKPHLKQLNEQRNPNLPTSEPLPSRVEDIRHDPMRTWFEMDGEPSPEPLGA